MTVGFPPNLSAELFNGRLTLAQIKERLERELAAMPEWEARIIRDFHLTKKQNRRLCERVAAEMKRRHG